MDGGQEEVRCSACGATAPPAARFCGRCGEVLDAGRPGDAAPVVRPPDTRGPPRPDRPDPAAPDAPPALVVEAEAPTPGVGTIDRRPVDRRSALVGGVVVALLVMLAVLVTRPTVDAIVVGDGLTIPSGPGPTAVPDRRWETELALVDTLPPVVTAETIVVAGRSGRGAALIGVDRTSGRRLWASPVADGPPVSLAAVDGDVVVVTDAGDDTTRVVRLSARTGREVWARPTTVPGAPERAVALPAGGSLVAVVDPSGAGRAVVVDGAGTVVLDEPGRSVAASSTLVARRAGARVHLHAVDGTPSGSLDLGALPTGGEGRLAVVGDQLVVGEGRTVRALDATTGEERWSTTTEADVVALAATSGGVAAVTRGEHVGLDLDGGVVWRDAGFPLPLVRDGDDVTLLVAPGTATALELRLVDAGGELREEVTVDRGAYLALGRSFVFAAVGDDVTATPLDAATATWSVETAGDVRWLVLDGPTMVAVSLERGGTVLSSWG